MAVPPNSGEIVLAGAAACPRKLALYGPSVELDSQVLELEPTIGRTLGPFAVSEWPGGSGIIRGLVRPYDEAEVVRRLPPAARPLHRPGDLMEIYAQDERFWVIDDRWGMSEINTLRGQWRSWVLPQPKLDPVKLTDVAILWPLAQLLKNQGVHLVPAVSAALDDFSALLLCPFGLEPELSAMLSRGYRLIGQQWTVLREEDEQILLLHMPGAVQREVSPRLRTAADDGWVDLTSDKPHTLQRHAFCQAVLVAEAGRRPRAHLRRVLPRDAFNLLRRSWPVADLHPHRRQGQLPVRLAQACPCFQLQLSRDPKDMLALLDSLRFVPRNRKTA